MAFASQHTYAVAYKDIAYELLQQEQDIIDFLLRKVVMMRELPLIKATKELEVENDLKEVEKQAKRLKKMTLNAKQASQTINTSRVASKLTLKPQ